MSHMVLISVGQTPVEGCCSWSEKVPTGKEKMEKSKENVQIKMNINSLGPEGLKEFPVEN